VSVLNKQKNDNRYTCNAFKLRETPKAFNMETTVCNKCMQAHMYVLQTFPRYQANYENSWWRRVELRLGNNPKDDEGWIDDLLKWAIRSQDPKSDNDEDMGEVQRLNGSGSEMSSHHR
jgi:hypothetical protein